MSILQTRRQHHFTLHVPLGLNYRTDLRHRLSRNLRLLTRIYTRTLVTQGTSDKSLYFRAVKNNK